ncbi:asparagine synthase C-terminal domain-containing protein [Tenacibaculum sp. 190524A02b]|uniref:asparagine synthase C-terminal domain-containing protein n=1 Tax=Tenacibaculum vairaonense TaxID=3137860 RepID=UPI0031FB2EE6
MHIHLKNNKGFQWFSKNNIFFKGYFFDEHDNFYEKEKAYEYLKQITSESVFKTVLNKINGVFSFIITTENTSFITSDVTRAFPLFYSRKDNSIFLSDDIDFIKKELNLTTFDTISEYELLASLHTYGKKTLLKNIFQVQASEYLIVKKEEITKRDFFYTYTSENNIKDIESNLIKNAINNIERSFNRLIISLKNSPVAVPLSGGFDSRLIAVMLKKYNYKNVICYTYGNKKSDEIKNSKKTAEKLGFKWYFIEYNDKITSNFLSSKNFKEYAHYAGKYSSMPNLQEYFAVQFLKNKKLIPDNTVFIPGYAGDLLGGSQFVKVIPKSLKTNEIFDTYACKKLVSHLFKNQYKEQFKNSLKETVQLSYNLQSKLAYSIFEDIDIKEKIAKYIFNSASFYTFYNYEHRFPFWDRALLDFFKDLHIDYKIGKHFFDKILIDYYFKPFKVYFGKELQPTTQMHNKQKIKNKIKKLAPSFVKQKVLLKNDWNNYYPIISQMISQMKKNNIKFIPAKESYNEIIVQWYLNFAKEKFEND